MLTPVDQPLDTLQDLTPSEMYVAPLFRLSDPLTYCFLINLHLLDRSRPILSSHSENMQGPYFFISIFE